MLSSGVETQPVPLDSPMSAGAQELYTELPVNISPELSAEFEPSIIPDAKPEASSSLVQTLPLEPQRTHVENCSQDADSMGDGEEPKGCGLAADCATRDPAKERVEQEEEEVRAPKEGSVKGQEQPSPAAAEGARGSCQVVLGKWPKPDLSGSPSEDKPQQTEENQGNIQVTTETLPKPTEEGQGMKVNGTKMISNAEHRNDKVSKSLPPGRLNCPDVDKSVTSGEVSETCTLVSLEPLTSVEPGLTKAPSTEKECGISSAHPLWPPSPEDSASLPLHSGDTLSKLSLDHKAVDNHQHNSGCDAESLSKTSTPQAKSKEGGVIPLEADPQGSCFPLSLPCVGSGSISLGECGPGDDLQKIEKPFWTGEVLREDSASRLEEGVQSVRSKSSKVLPVNSKPRGVESTTAHLNIASDQRGGALDSCCIRSPSWETQGSLRQENSLSPSEEDPMNIPSEIQENFKKYEGKRVTRPCDTYQDSIEESNSMVMQTEESEKTFPGNPSVLGKNIDSQSPRSLVSSQRCLGSITEKRDPTACSVPDEPLTPVSKVSEVKSVLLQLQTDQKCDLANQPEAKETIGISSRVVIPFVDGQRIASYPVESNEDKGKLLCVLSGEMSFDSCDHKEATAPQESSLGDHAEDISKGTSELSQQQAMSEHGAEVFANHQTILTQMREVKDAFHPGATTCRASCKNHDISAKAVSFKRVPNNTVIGKLVAMSGLEKEVELFEQAPDLEHEGAQPQECHSCQQSVENAPEGDMCSEGITYKSTAISPEAENQSVLNSEDILVPSDPLCPGTESSLVESILSVRHPSGENEHSREEIEDSFQEGKIRNEVASHSLLSRALNKSTLALSHVKPGNFIARPVGKLGLEEKKLGTHSKETVLPCESHPSEHSVLESQLSSNIPRPKELKDLCLDTNGTNQADGTNQGLNCQSDLNTPVECWSGSNSSKSKHHGKGIFELQHTDSTNKGLSSSHKKLLVKDLSNVPLSCSLPKKNIFKTSLGTEDSPVCRTDPAQLGNKLGEEVSEIKESNSAGSHRRQEEPSWLQPYGSLRSDQSQGGEGLIDQDTILPCTSDSFNVKSLKTVPSCEGTPSVEQRDDSLCNAVSWKSKMHGMGSVTNHEPNTELSDTVNVLFGSTHRGRIVEEMLPEEIEGTTTEGGLRPQTNSAFDDEDSLEVYSKELVLRSAKTMPLHISSQEYSGTGSDGRLGEKAETKQLSESVNVKVLPEIVKSSTLKTKVKKRPPGGTSNIDTRGRRGTPAAFQPKLVSNGTPSFFKLNPENKMNRRETKEHQGTLNDLKVREESEGKTLKEDGGDESSDAYSPRFKQKRTCGETETQKAQIVQGCRCLKGGQWGMQPKKRGTFPQQEASLHAKSFIRPTAGPSSQDSASQSRLKGHAHTQSALTDIIGAQVTKDDPSPQSLKMDDSEAGRRALHLRPKTELSLGPCFPISTIIPQDIGGSGCEKMRCTFAMTPYQRKSLPPLKKRQNITLEPIKTGRKMSDVQKWNLVKNASETMSVKEHKVLSWSSAAPSSSASVANHTPKPKAMGRLLLNSTRLQKPTKESALLNKLSVLAGKLLATSTATQELGSQPRSAQLLPVAETYKRLRFKKFQDESPYDMMQLNLHVGDYGCNKTLDSQTLALYPLEALRVGFLDLMNKMPSLQFNAQIFPISFRINLDSELPADSTRIFSEHCSPPESAPGGDPMHPPQPPKWTFSFLMSQGSSGTATFREDDGLHCELLSHAALQTLSPEQAPGSNAIVKVRAGCSVLGLHTVLALSSPGCYRIWTRRRSLSSHLPTIQRLFMTQFTQGFKGLRLPASLSNSLFPSLPYSVGRVLSIWSQHGPSACPFEITTLHSKHSKWPPTLGIRNSHAILPNVPLLGMEATSARTGGSPVRPGSPLSALAPKSRLAFEPVVSVLRLSASDFQIPAFKELRRVPAVCTSQHSSATQKEIEPEKRPKKVSQIRIRKTIPRPDPNLTPMGLPRPKRLKKKEFSLEEIYTNKNYKSPPASRCLETIFEEPKERNGALISVSQQKRKRVLEFQDFTVPRKRRNRGKIKVMGSFTRAKKAALQSRELDALLIQKLMDLEAFLAKEGEDEPASGC
ncbi:protein PRR14L [Trichosurus vulpecula]|uniref:protein PRR14L n=1 Tax=Trichosurus vulpecula TaxID=9337 RepID=UPI00186B2FAD|nr:protein PRR14L [Trichosurus vulpecula]